MKIELFENQRAYIDVHLPVEAPALELYGGTRSHPFSVAEQSGGVVRVALPPMPLCSLAAGRYDVFARESSTGREWLVLSGEVEVKPRCSELQGEAFSPVVYRVNLAMVDRCITVAGEIVRGVPGKDGKDGKDGATAEAVKALLTAEQWVFTLENGEQVTRTVYVDD